MGTGGVGGFPGSHGDGLAYDGARGYRQESGLGYGGKKGGTFIVMMGRYRQSRGGLTWGSEL